MICFLRKKIYDEHKLEAGYDLSDIVGLPSLVRVYPQNMDFCMELHIVACVPSEFPLESDKRCLCTGRV